MIAGEIDMCVYSGSLLSSARLQGVDVVMVASFLNKPLYRLVVRPEIRTVADLKGKRLGITRFGTVTDSNLAHLGREDSGLIRRKTFLTFRSATCRFFWLPYPPAESSTARSFSRLTI